MSRQDFRQGQIVAHNGKLAEIMAMTHTRAQIIYLRREAGFAGAYVPYGQLRPVGSAV